MGRAAPERELQRLIQIYLKAETDIINEIGRLRSMGLVDYHAEAALARIQAILRKLDEDRDRYVPRMIEMQFYVSHPEARKPLNVPETPEKHMAGYLNASALTGEQMDIVQRLVTNLTGQLMEADVTVYATLSNALLGRDRQDVFRQVGLERTVAMEALGRGAFREVPGFVEALRREGVTAFVDRAGRRWSLHTYASMALRTTSRQAEILSVLTQDDGWDLFKISAHGTTCPLCAPLEGRVYSKSGTDTDFPPLSAAFGKLDETGPDDLTNSRLNIHPNCLHQLIRWTPIGRSEEELQKIKDFSSFQKNPPTRDPRSQKQIEAYREKERGRARWLNDYRQWERYQETLGDDAPRTFETFLKHKRAGDEKYKGWKNGFREAKQLEKYSKVRYHEDGTVVVTDTWEKHRSIPMRYRPNAVVETRFSEQIDRIFYDEHGRMSVQIHSGDHGQPKYHALGKHGEHAHDFLYDSSGAMKDRVERKLSDREREENGDIL